MTVHSTVIRAYIESSPDAVEMPMLNGLAVQIVPTVETLGKARTNQCAAVIASEALLIVWDDDAVNLLTRAKTIEWEVMQLFWTEDPFKTPAISTAPSKAASKAASKTGSKTDITVIAEKQTEIDSLEAAAPKPRPTILTNTCLVSFSLFAIIAVLGLGLMKLVQEYRIEQGFVTNPYTRFAFMALTPIWFFFGMFFFNVLIVNLAQIAGPISQINLNSKHYSAHKVPRITKNLPHVTVQCPVYKESLQEVIIPTIQSIKKAISTYELQGGSANIFINDDGLQLISEELRDERIAFYSNNGIGWVARPEHDKSADGFKRKGKFKKASNMNFALALSCAMEDKLMSLERHQAWNSTDEAEATVWALEQAVTDGGNIAWADGNIRIGDYILISESLTASYEN